MATKKPESKFADKVIRFLRANYPGYWRNIHGGPFQARGIPDIVGCHRGRWVSFELKMDGNTASAMQEDNGEEIQASQGIWAVCYTLAEIKSIMEREFPNAKEKLGKRSSNRSKGNE